MSGKQHEKHEINRKAFEARHVRTNEVRAFGKLAYASMYVKGEELCAIREEARVIRELQGKPARNWVVERLTESGEWLTADKSMQCPTFEHAVRSVQGMSQYRVRRLFGRSRHN
jgi:hypothetical protein